MEQTKYIREAKRHECHQNTIAAKGHAHACASDDNGSSHLVWLDVKLYFQGDFLVPPVLDLMNMLFSAKTNSFPAVSLSLVSQLYMFLCQAHGPVICTLLTPTVVPLKINNK